MALSSSQSAPSAGTPFSQLSSNGELKRISHGQYPNLPGQSALSISNGQHPDQQLVDLTSDIECGANSSNPEDADSIQPTARPVEDEEFPSVKRLIDRFYNSRNPTYEARGVENNSTDAVQEPSRVSEATKAAISPPREQCANEQATSAARSTDSSSSEADSDDSSDTGNNSSGSEDNTYDIQSGDKSRQAPTSEGPKPFQRSNSEVSTHRHRTTLTAQSFSSTPVDSVQPKKRSPSPLRARTTNAATRPSKSPARNTIHNGEWPISKIIGKRRKGRGIQYRIRWTDTWLPASELNNAKRLLQEFEANSQGRQRS